MTAKDVFEIRRNGNFQKAYKMALNLAQIDPQNEWNKKALKYCIRDLAIASLEEKHYNDLKFLIKNFCNIPTNDDKKMSEDLGWQLYKHTEYIFKEKNINIHLAKQILFYYLQLNNEKPSILHSCFLRNALKLADSKDFNIINFLKIWDLNNFLDNDFEGFKPSDNKEIPSTVEKTLQKMCKFAISNNSQSDLLFALENINNFINNFQKNIWLTYYKARILNLMGRREEALKFAIKITRQKIREPWAWGMIGDMFLNTDKQKAMACFCRALSIKFADEFKINIRKSLAKILLDFGLKNEACCEIREIFNTYSDNGWNIKEDMQNLINMVDLNSNNVPKNNNDFYRKYIEISDEILLYDLEWLKAEVGNTFDKNGLLKTKIYILLKDSDTPLAISIKTKQFNRLKQGQSILIKADLEDKFIVYAIKQINEKFDILKTYIGVISYISQNNIARFIINKNISCYFDLKVFNGQFEIGDKIAIKMIKNSKGREGYQVLSIEKTDLECDENVLVNFKGKLNLIQHFGFVEDVFDVYVDSALISQHRLRNGIFISGVAVLSYDKKKNHFGYKAIKIKNIDF